MDSLTKEKVSWVQETEIQHKKHRDFLVENIQNNQNLTGRKTRRVMGIDCEIPDVKTKKAFCKDLILQTEREERIRKKLRKKGIPFEAVLPKATFKNLIADMPFYTFKTINEEGRAYGDTEALSKVLTRPLFGFVILLTIVFSSLPILAGVFLSSETLLWIGISCAGTSIIGLGVFCSIVEFNDFIIKDNINRDDVFCWSIGALITPHLCLSFFLVVPFVKPHGRLQGKMGKLLWPQKTDETYHERNATMVTIKIPEPLQHVKKIMVDCIEKQLSPYLVVHEKAFQVELSKKDIQEMRSQLDPIICTDTEEDGEEFTVIHTQWGDFPEEKELIANIKKHFNVLQEEFLMPTN